MTATHDSGATRPARWLDGLKRARFVLAAAALAFGALWLLGAIAAGPALAGFALIAAAVLIATASAETTPALLPRDEPRAPRIGDPLIEAVLAGLPDPVVALDHRGDVVALNVRAAAVAPALRPGESVSLGLRVPEVLEAIRHARASGTSQRAEFFQRVPFDRWYEAIVTPILSSGVDSRPGLLLLAFHDLTPLRRVEEMRRLHCQCQPRAAHTACGIVGVHRHAARVRARGSCGARALPRHHAGAGRPYGAPDRRSPVTLAHRAQRASAARQAGRSRRHRSAGRR